MADAGVLVHDLELGCAAAGGRALGSDERMAEETAAAAKAAGGLDGSTEFLGPVRRVRSVDDVTAQLQQAIVSGRLKPGDRLPTERELTEIFGVGRPTLREALRFLEAHGIIEIRPGKTGGAFVVAPSEETLANTLSTLLALSAAAPADLAEFRLSFEPENAWWAAQRATPEEVAHLQDLAESAAAAAATQDQWLYVGEIDAHWHEALARATKNSLRIGISLGTHETLRRNHEAVMRSVLASGPDVATHVAKIASDMAMITAAIGRRDADAVRTAMRRHIEDGNRFNDDLATARQ
jgi:GntR family transcriptional regulator, transcriptional repressor for pyruvate dehydrogenase complex